MAGGEKFSFEQIANSLKALSPARRVVLGLVAVGVPLAFAFLILQAKEPDFGLLFSQLKQEDAALVVEKLREEKIPFRLTAGGSAVLVPLEKVYELRLQLAAEGLPKGGGAGFELLDKMPMGSTGFVQRLNYVRGLQGELARTIQNLDAIEAARVHVVLPRKSLFLEEQKETTASVLLQMRSGARLTQRQISGITFLVARAVEGLDPANVTLVDVNGNILSGGRGDSAEQITSSQLEFQLAFERNLERRVQTMLEKVTGPQNVIVRVASELDFRRVEETEEAFDPDGVVVRSEQRGKETSAAGSGRSASANAGGGGSGKESQATRENETTNFEISKTVRHVQEAVGKPKKISVAVLLGTPKRAGGDSKAAPPEINEDTLAQIQTLVKTAIGFNADRGDQVEVVKLSYDLATTATVSDLEPVESGGLGSGLMPLLIRYGSIALMGVLVLLFFVRPLMRFATGGATRDREMIRLPKTVDELETELEGEPEGSAAEGTPALPKGPSRKERLHQLAKDDPERLVSIARTWLQDEG